MIIRLHQRSTLSMYYFTFVLDVFEKLIQEIALRRMIIANEAVLHGESREKLNRRPANHVYIDNKKANLVL